MKEKILIKVMLFLFIFISSPSLTFAQNWLTNWQYRKLITISELSGNTLTNYQVLIANPIYNESGLAGSWHFNEGSGSIVSDSSGSWNIGNLVNNPTWIDGKFGKALKFDGIDDYVDFGDILNMAGQSLTISSWIYPNSLPPSGYTAPYIARRQNSGSFNADYLVEITSTGGVSFTYYNGAWYGCGTGGGLITTGNWYHIVVTFDGNTKICKIYINSVERASATLAVGFGSNSGSIFRIAYTWYTTNNKYFNGIIDEVRIYKRVLTSQEIQALYQAKARLDYGDIRFTDSDGTTLLNHWQEADGKFWVNITFIPALAIKKIYVYYGNPSASSTSSVANTFISNQIFLVTGTCNQATYCYYTDNHGEFDYIRERIGISPFTIHSSGYVTSINHNSNPYGSSDFYYSRYRFLFVPSISGTYYFGTNSDDASEITFFPSDGYGGGIRTTHPYGAHDVVAYWYGGHGSGTCGSSGTIGSRNLIAGQGYWIDYMQEEWAGGQLAQMCIKIPGVDWVVVNTANANFVNKIFSRKYTTPEPTYSIGNEEKYFNFSLSVSPSSGNVVQGGFVTTTITATLTSTTSQPVSFSCGRGNWLTGWQYRMPINITERSGNTLTNYQVLVNLDTASLISAGKMRSDCGDIRFTDSDGTTLLSYWLEEPPKYSPDSNGFIGDWLILGTFSGTAVGCGSNDQTELVNVNDNFYPGKVDSGKTWFEHHRFTSACGGTCNNNFGIDLNCIFGGSGSGPPDYVNAYVFAYIYSPTSRTVKLRVGSDDGIRVWINGNMVWNNHAACRCWANDQDIFQVTLNEGWNKLLIRVGEKTGNWGFVARFTDLQGNPITDIRISLSPPCQFSSNTKLWVNVTSIPASATKTIYLYYGNFSATSASNGNATFILFDDFDTKDTAKWLWIDGGYGVGTVSGGIASFPRDAGIISTSLYSSSAIARARMKVPTGVTQTVRRLSTILTYSTSADNPSYFGQIVYSGDSWRTAGSYIIYSASGTATLDGTTILTSQINVVPANNVWYIVELGRTGSSLIFKDDLGNTLSATHTTLTGNFGAGFRNWGNSPINAQLDWILIRKYTSPEPTTSVGAEEQFIAQLPLGVACTFNPSSCSPTCNSVLNISTSPTTPLGTYEITIIATGGGLTRTTTYTLIVTLGCSGSVSLTLNPSTVISGGIVTPSASNLINCGNKVVYFKRDNCAGAQVSSCTIPSGNGGCTGNSFSAPSSVGAYTYYACIDKNGDGDFSDDGEQNSKTLTVIPEVGPLTTFKIYPGWNLISSAFKVITNVTLDPCNLKDKKLYYLNRATEKWEEKSWTQLEAGKGYWIFSEAKHTCEIEISGAGNATIVDIPPLKRGWNLIGAPFNSTYFPSIIGNCSVEIGPLYWNSTSQPPSWNKTDLLLPKIGYWINVKENCNLG